MVTAFSREGPKKVYVQHRLKELGKEINDLLQQKAYLYVCGDAANMAREVNTVLAQIIAEQRGTTEAKGEEIVKNMRAAGFRWDSSEKKWLFNNVVIRTFNGDTESVSYQHSYIATMNFQPIDLRKDEYLKDQMTTKELRQFIRKEKERGSEMINSLLVEKHNRTAIPASVFILTIIGSVLASKKVRGGSGIHLALGVIISVTYILFSRLSIVFATQGNFPPVLAAWFPNILFGIVAIYLYSKAQK